MVCYEQILIPYKNSRVARGVKIGERGPLRPTKVVWSRMWRQTRGPSDGIDDLLRSKTYGLHPILGEYQNMVIMG